jgi:hypothetical protein
MEKNFISSPPFYRTAILTGLVIILAILMRLFLIAASLENVPATSDEASIVLQAKEIACGNFPLLFLGQPLLLPVEAYTMAPLVEWLPRNTLGARYQTWVLGSFSVIGFLIIARTVFAKNERWPAYLLILFPSSYLLLLTFGYSPPQYPTSLTLAWVSILLVLRHRCRPRVWLPGLAGAACGLAISNHLLFLPVTLGAFTLIVFNGDRTKGLKNSLSFGFWLCLGLIPLLAAILMIPGAYSESMPAQSLHQTIPELFRFVISESLAGAMGMNPNLFPDFRDARQLWIKEVRVLFAIGYVALCGYLLTLRVSALVRNLRERTWPKLELVDATLVISLLTILIFAAHNNEYFAFRYLIHAVWCFPFLVGYAYATASGRRKQCIATVVACCVVFNVVCSTKMIRQWRKPGRISSYADLPPLAPLLKTLSSMQIDHCYASFWLAYRISFETDEKIKCTGPYNERFAHWPIPYKQEVDADEKTVYVLTQTLGARLTALEFEANTAMQGITYEKLEVGDRSAPFNIYHHFTESEKGPDRFASIKESIDCRGHGFDSGGAAAMCHQEAWGEFTPLYRVSLTEHQTLTRLQLQENPLLANLEENLRLAVRDHDHWRILENGRDYSFLRLSFEDGHPLYHESFRLIRFEETSADALSIGWSHLSSSSSGQTTIFTLYAKP